MKKWFKFVVPIIIFVAIIFAKNDAVQQKKAMIIGATSGIGKALTQVLLENNYIVGATGRRIELLTKLKEKYSDKIFVQKMDVTQVNDAIKSFNELVEQMKGVDIVVISSGIGHVNPDLDLQKELETIAVNVTGFVAIANIAYKYFEQQKSGHLVGISSIAALFGNRYAPAYSASKAFEINYLNGLRAKTYKSSLPITITEILPGFVDTPMINKDEAFWVATPQEAAEQIYDAIKSKKTRAYITRRWALVAWLLKIIPNSILNRFL